MLAKRSSCEPREQIFAGYYHFSRRFCGCEKSPSSPRDRVQGQLNTVEGSLNPEPQYLLPSIASHLYYDGITRYFSFLGRILLIAISPRIQPVQYRTPEHDQSFRADTIDKHSWSPIGLYDTSHDGLEHFLFSAAGRIPNSVGGSGRHHRAELRYGFLLISWEYSWWGMIVSHRVD